MLRYKLQCMASVFSLNIFILARLWNKLSQLRLITLESTSWNNQYWCHNYEESWLWPMLGSNPRSRGCEEDTLSIGSSHQCMLICWHVQIYVRGMLGISSKHAEICQCFFLYAEAEFIFWTCLKKFLLMLSKI